MDRRRLCSLVAAVATIVLAGGSAAQSFPTGPVKLISPFPAGSGPDAVTRMLGQRFAERWKQPVLVENRPGANGFIAMEAAKHAPPTGHEMLIADVGHLSVNPSLFRRLPYDPERDFAPVGVLYRTTFFLAVGRDSPFQSVRDLVDAAAKGANRVSYGSNGIGGPLHLGGAQLAHVTQTQMLHVPFKDGNVLYASLANGDLDFVFTTIASAGALQRAGKLRFMAIADDKRSPAMPQVPTIEEAKGPKLRVDSWLALLVPAGTPQSVVSAINTAVNESMKHPDMARRLEGLGLSAAVSTPDELAQLIRTDRVRFAELVKRIGIPVE
jgi:tripartite-type tricarboxylate transporter receptor subunit TctC